MADKILRHTQGKKIIQDFLNDKREIYSLAPGYSTNIITFFDSVGIKREHGYLNSSEIKSDLKDYFGSFDGQFERKGGISKALVYEYRQEIIMSLSGSSNIGTSWYWIRPNAGSQYGQPMLLCNDNLVKAFWPDFCTTLYDLLKT